MSLSSEPFDAFHVLHHHLDSDVCPMCDQVIPNDRLEQVRARQVQHRRELESQYALKLKAERDLLMAQHQQQSEDAIAKVRKESEAREAAAREAERKAANAQADLKVSAANCAAEAARVQTEQLRQKLEASDAAAVEKVNAARLEERRVAAADADAKAVAANSAMEALRVQLDEHKRQLEASAAATAEKVTAAQEAARKEAEAAMQAQLTSAQAAAQEAQDRVRGLSESEQNAQARIGQLTQEVATAHQAGRTAAETELRSQLTTLTEEKQAAVNAKAAAEQQAEELRRAQEKALRDAVQETRDALEKSHRDASNAEQAKHFEEKQKFQNTVDDLKRQLENKTALELGEGAEVDLFEALKGAFPDDDITRIKRGVAGADIRHLVRHNGKDCGLILYDSKNHKAWRNDFVTKLRDDQIADQADHAILSTLAFPQGTRQLHVQDGVIVLNPARAVAIAEITRRHVIQAHSLNLSSEDREQKSLELYGFINSERFGALMTKLNVTTDSLNELDAKEQAAHKVMWQKRGQLINGVAKAGADLKSEIDRIIGTADTEADDTLVALLADTAGTGA
jgi:hypothetical protein